MAHELAVAHVEWLVVYEQADDLAVGDVDHRLASFGIAVAGLGIGQRSHLVERVEVGTRQPPGLALVEVAPQPNMPVGQREDRFGLSQQFEVELALRHRPRLYLEYVLPDHGRSKSSARSLTTTSAPLRRSASACPVRSTPTTQPNPPARPASTPACASSNTAASAGCAPSMRAAARKVSGAGLPASRSRSAIVPSMISSKRWSMPAATSTSRQLVLEETTARRSPWSRTVSAKRTEP